MRFYSSWACPRGSLVQLWIGSLPGDEIICFKRLWQLGVEVYFQAIGQLQNDIQALTTGYSYLLLPMV